MSRPASLATLRGAPRRDIPPAAINPKTGSAFAAARIRNPDNPELFYRHGDANTPWVKTGYSTWSLGLWVERFGQAYGEGDARSWDFFGEPIDLWPPGSDGYSDE